MMGREKASEGVIKARRLYIYIYRERERGRLKWEQEGRIETKSRIWEKRVKESEKSLNR